MAADIIQVCQDGQVVFKGGVAEPQGRENRKSRVELARGRRVFTGYMAILMAVTGPSMQAYYLVKQRRFPASMIDDQ